MQKEHRLAERAPLVLIAEDLEMNARLLSVLLKNFMPKCRIHTAEDGEKTWEAFKNLNPDIIFMDIQMPVMDGVETALKIRSSDHPNADVPIIAISAGAVKEQKPRCMKAGMNHYITKPVLKPVLQNALLTYLPDRNTLG